MSHSVNNMENVRNLWKPELYRIQMEAPKPKVVVCEAYCERPEYFGTEYHGIIGHKEATLLLDGEPDGAFLIRKGNEMNDFYTLTWRFNNKVHHYKLYYDGTYYIKEKKFEGIYDLVADGLITMHMELKARHILNMINSASATSFTESPYVTLNRTALNTLSRKQNSTNQNLNINKIQESNSIAKTKKDLVDVTTTFDLTPTFENSLLTKYTKMHIFKVHNFKGLNWCELCANFLWGFTAQGVKCEDCGFIAHMKCSERVPNHCVPDLKKLRGVFGIDLTTLLNMHSNTLPFVVSKCVTEIESRGVESEGLYRVSGFADEIEALKMAFDKDGEATDLSGFNINVIAGTLKLYLRLLPVPLITYDVHDKFVHSIQMKTTEEQVPVLRQCMDMLSPAHFNCLQYVMLHLHRVSLKADMNKMSAHNLSTVFAPTLVATPPAFSDLSFEIRALQALIENCPQIFYVDKLI